MPIRNSSHLKYQAYVDGLRAIAVLSVIFYHADLGFGGGYVGVDVFFVISGYLITGLILKDLEAGKLHIFDFWERRVRRILPALAVVVLACLAAGWLLYFPQDFKELGQSMLAQSLLVSNIYFYFDASYFGQGVEVKPLLHTWSLAVEEQFYLLFPFLLIGFKRFSHRSIVPAILLLCVASFSLSVYSSYAHPRANFYLLPTRAWELLIGALLAAIPAHRATARLLPEVLSWCGLFSILWAIFFYDRDTRFPGLAASLPCLGAALVIWSNGHTLTSVGKLLSVRPVVFIGLISYSLYLWHWPVLVFFKYRMLGSMPQWERFFLMIASIVLAALSLKFVETPVRKRIVFGKRWQIFSFGGIATALLFSAGLMVYEKQGLPGRIPPNALQYLAGNSTVIGNTNSIGGRQLSLSEARNADFNKFGSGDTNLPVGLLVWGDSHAQVELPILDIICREHSIRGAAATHSQTAPLLGYKSSGVWSLGEDSIDFNNAVIQFIRSSHVNNVLIIARWDYYLALDKGTDRLHDALLATINALHNSGTRLWIMRQVPKYPWDVPKALASAVLHGQDPETLGLTMAEQRKQSHLQDPIFEGLAQQFPEVTIIDPAALFVDASGRCRVVNAGQALYFDSDHVSVAGTMILRPMFEQIFYGVGKQPLTTQKNSGSLGSTVQEKTPRLQ